MVAAILFACSVFGFAQSTVDGALDGHISDSSGALVPNVQVTIVNTGTNATSTVASDSSGYYRATRLQPGDYKITFIASGFSQRQLQHVVVEVGRVTTIDQSLSISNSSQTVEVSAEASQLNTESAEISSNTNQKAINNLPINGRRWVGFVLLTPGAVLGSQFGLISFKGVSSLLNNNSVDGADDMRAFESSERGYTRVAYSTSQAAIQEFQTISSNYSAQYGRAAGGVINAITKSGGNEFHGSAFWYYRDNDFGATNPFNILSSYDPITGNTVSTYIKPKDKRHQFGGTLGGPLIKDKLFFFYAYDQQLRNFPAVATPSSGSFFNITQASQNICATGYSVQSCLLSRGATLAQINNSVSFLEGLTGIEPRKGNEAVNFPKLDWKVNDHNNASVEYNRMRWDSPGGVQTNPVNPYALHSFGNNFVKVDSIIGKLDTFWGPNVSNEARYEYARDFDTSTLETAAPGVPLTGPNGQPTGIVIGGGGLTFGTPTNLPQPAYPDERENQIVDTVIWSHRNHTFSAGFDFRHVNDHANYIGSLEGQYTFANMADWITEYLRSTGSTNLGCNASRNASPGTLPCYQNYQQGFIEPSGFTFNTNDIAGFVQDDWKMLPNLSVNLGLRYEYEKLPDPQIPNIALPQTSIKPSDKNNIGPRFGFSWDPFHSGKTAIRGGYGIFYGRIINGAIYQVLSNSAAQGAQYTLSLNPVNSGILNPLAPRYPNTFSTTLTTTAARSVSVYSPNLQNPMIQQADLSIQRDLGWRTTISGSYVLALGRELPNYLDTNIAPSTGFTTYSISGGRYNGKTVTVPLYSARINPSFNAVTELISNINSNYNAMILQVEHRLDQNLQFQMSYTFSKALDDGQNQTLYGDTNDQFDPFTVRPDYGISLVNCPQKVVGSLVWQPVISSESQLLKKVLNDWNISPTVTLQSGLPYSYGISGTNNTITTVPGASASINGSGGPNYLPLAGRNSQRLPSIKNVDLHLARAIPIREKVKLEAVGESFNLFNTRNITGANTTAYTASGNTLVYQSIFGLPNAAGNTVYRERQIQFALRLEF